MTAALLLAVVAFAAGAALGWAYFSALRRSVEALALARRSARWMGAMVLLRVLSAAAVLSLTTLWAGWPGLVAALCGFLAMRFLYVRAFGGAPP